MAVDKKKIAERRAAGMGAHCASYQHSRCPERRFHLANSGRRKAVCRCPCHTEADG